MATDQNQNGSSSLTFSDRPRDPSTSRQSQHDLLLEGRQSTDPQFFTPSVEPSSNFCDSMSVGQYNMFFGDPDPDSFMDPNSVPRDFLCGADLNDPLEWSDPIVQNFYGNMKAPGLDPFASDIDLRSNVDDGRTFQGLATRPVGFQQSLEDDMFLDLPFEPGPSGSTLCFGPDVLGQPLLQAHTTCGITTAPDEDHPWGLLNETSFGNNIGASSHDELFRHDASYTGPDHNGNPISSNQDNAFWRDDPLLFPDHELPAIPAPIPRALDDEQSFQSYPPPPLWTLSNPVEMLDFADIPTLKTLPGPPPVQEHGWTPTPGPSSIPTFREVNHSECLLDRGAMQPLPPLHGVYTAEDMPKSGEIAVSAKRKRSAVVVRGSLPPAKRGGRRGPLDPSQRKHQREMRFLGVCIRCRRSRIKCTGGIPCEACRKRATSTIWKNPCIKAHFLDIIEAGSFFPHTTLYQLLIIEREEEASIISQFLCATGFASQRENFSFNSVGFNSFCKVPWVLGVVWFALLFFEERDSERKYTRPTSLGLPQKLAQILSIAASGEVLASRSFLLDLDEYDRRQYLLSLSPTASYDFEAEADQTLHMKDSNLQEQHPLGKTINFLIWITSRLQELCICRYLQRVSNNMSSFTSDDKMKYISSMMLFLLRASPITESLTVKFGMSSEDSAMKAANAELQDRQRRLRMAFWVYVSIATRELPSFSDFWQTFRKNWPLIFRDNMATSFRDDFSKFEQQISESIEHAIEPVETFEKFSAAFSSARNLNVWNEALRDHTTTKELYAKLLSGQLNNDVSAFDVNLTGGLLTADTEHLRRTACIRIYANVNTIAWQDLVSNVEVIRHFHADQRLSYLLSLISDRRDAIRWYDQFFDAPELGLSERDPLRRWEDLHADPSNPFRVMFGTLEVSDLTSNLRRGKRWKQLVDMFGSDEVLLLGSPDFSSFSGLPHTDIGTVIENIGDAEFDSLRHILSTRCRWMSEILSNLSGLTQMIMGLKNGDFDRSYMAERISDRVRSVFGDRLAVATALKHGVFVALGLNYMRRMVPALYPVDDFDKNESKNIPRKKLRRAIDQGMARCIDAVVRGECHDQRQLVVRVEKELRQAMEETLTDEYFAPADKLEKASFFLHLAINVFLETMLECVFDRQALDTTRERLVPEDIRKICGKCHIATHFAFQ
ncbi:hypothetical protein CLAIMM_08267 [Cladophialophora immunda]|nr:hypothetical protein CLAIMM_08267 [Cladophialophora immunda]